MDFEKSWSKDAEKQIMDEWVSRKSYEFSKESPRKVYSIDTPPPYINTPIHIGHATTYTLMDMFARHRRMLGFNVLFPLGLDKNGLPIEVAAEKRFNVKLRNVEREKFIEMCRQVLEEAGAVSISSFQRLGISFNSWDIGSGIGKIYETDSADYRALTQSTFIDLWNKGLIYEDERINNFCTGCQTTLADAEVEYAELQSFFNHVFFTVKETGEKIIIGTTRPELLSTCAIVIFHPDDKRYSSLDGKTAITPIYNKEVPIRAHAHASMEKGTGLVMMCSMGDTSDVRFFRDMGLEPVIAINSDGRMNENAGFLQGLKVSEARKAIIEKLRQEGFLVKQEQVIHKTPMCERSKEPIEFISMKEFYVRQVKLKPKMRALAKKLKFYDNSSRQILLDWIDSVSIDWPISRRRYYATEIPLWYCASCNNVIVPEKGKYYRPWKENPPVEKCTKCGNSEFRGETRVLDTWFDSSNSPLYILQYSKDDSFFNTHTPCSLRPQGKEIIRTWLYYTILKCYLMTDKLIFDEAWINFHIVDEKGYKMSKSKGNVIDPNIILDKYGAEPFRLWCAMEGNLEKGDFKCSFDRIDGAGKTIIKLWNVSRFISMFPNKPKPSKLVETDEWILQELNSIVGFSSEKYMQYDFHNPTAKIRNFLWETFASHYMELVKNRAYNQDSSFTEEEQASAFYTLHECLDTILKLWSPVIPFVTYSIYSRLRGKDVHSEQFPETFKKKKQKFSSEELIALNSAIWKAKKDKGLSLKAEVKEAYLPKKFKIIGRDLAVAHSIKSLKWGDKVEVSF